MTEKIVFLLAFAFYAGILFGTTKSLKWQIAFIVACLLGGMLAFYAPLVYGATGIIASLALLGLLSAAKPEDISEAKRKSIDDKWSNEDKIAANAMDESSFRINSFITMLLFWPVNMFHMAYSFSKMGKRV